MCVFDWMETGYAAINIHVLREQTSENDLVVINNLLFLWLGRLMVIRQYMWLGNWTTREFKDKD